MKPCSRQPAKLKTESDRNSTFLVIGYGNELRGDDAVGPIIARKVEALCLPGVRVITSQQLAPELADDIAQANRVVFVDAAVDVAEVTFREVTAGPDTNIVAHCNSPSVMLALAQAIFGGSPRAWAVTIPVQSLGFTDHVSSSARHAADVAVEQIRALVDA